ncbi:hypothetical protein ACA29_24175 [Lederbergia galactosidilytica]|uniref:SDR-like Ig domain-containing protein n=1 Tax=Lederbergia galactosidilytica TaxID=217031 RepID=A0A0Q9XMR0_9BACI|nr:hypothetical protein ACA29_24175 [Lederbergia galactosidilytica]
MRKRVSLLFIMLLLMQTLSNGLMLAAPAQAKEHTDNAFSGVDIAEPNGESSTVDVRVDWDLKGIDLEVENQFVFPLPEEIQIQQAQSGKLLDKETEIGEYKASADGLISASFNEKAKEHPEAKGNFMVQAEHVKQEVTEDEPDQATQNETTDKEEVKDEPLEEVTESDRADEQQEEKASDTEGTAEIETDKEEKEEETVEVNTDEEQEVTNEEEIKETVEDEGTEKKDTATSAATDVQPQAVELGNIFTFDYFKVNEEDVEDGAVIEIGNGTKVEVAYAWDTEGLNAKAGDTASIKLPDIFKRVNMYQVNEL